MASSLDGLAYEPRPVQCAPPLSESFKLFVLCGLLTFAFVPIPVFINVSQLLLLALCAIAIICYLVRFEWDIFASLSLIFAIAISQGIGIAHFASADKNYLTPFLFITSMLIAPAVMMLARSIPAASRDRMVPRVVKWVLVFLTVECVSRLIASPCLGVTSETNLSDSLYRYKTSLFFVDSNFVGIEILCLLAIMFAYKDAIGRSQWILAYILLFCTLSRASIAAGLCQWIIYKLWRWRVWTFLGLLTAQALIIGKLLATFSAQGAGALKEVDGSLSSKIVILARMASSYAQADVVQRLFGVGVGDSINLIDIFAHNIVATFVLELGVCGTLLFAVYAWIISRRCPVCIYLLIFPIAINGFSLVSTSMPYFFAGLGLLAALRCSSHDGSGFAGITTGDTHMKEKSWQE